MKISVVIPSVGRVESLKELLISLEKGHVKPEEVLVIEQVRPEEVSEMVNGLGLDIDVRVELVTFKSAAKARQIGAELATGDLVCFFDDDTIVPETYLETAREYLDKNQQVLGLCGLYNYSSGSNVFMRALAIFFGLYGLGYSNQVLASGQTDYVRGRAAESIQTAEWLFGCNMVLRKKVFAEFSFNTDLLRGSYGEDVWFSYQISRKYPEGLVYHPDLSVVHEAETAEKVPSEIERRMVIVYRFLFWREMVYSGKFGNILAYLWAQLGLSLLDIQKTRSVVTLRQRFVVYRYLWNNRTTPIDMQAYNQFIFNPAVK